MSKILILAGALILAATVAAEARADMTVCTIRHDGYAYEGPGSAIEPKQLFPIQKGDSTVVAKWGERWH